MRVNDEQAAEAPAGTIRAEEIHPCAVCPMRSTKENATFGYCEGCTRVTRHCRGCQQNKPQSEWGWGFLPLVGLLQFLCSDCRVPAPPDVRETHPRFGAQLDFGGQSQRYHLAEVLCAVGRTLGTAGGSPACTALERMASCLRINTDGAIDVDVSDVPLQSREVIEEGLARNAYVSDPGLEASLRSLRWAWSAFLEESKPRPPAPEAAPTVAERSRQAFGEIWD